MSHLAMFSIIVKDVWLFSYRWNRCASMILQKIQNKAMNIEKKTIFFCNFGFFFFLINWMELFSRKSYDFFATINILYRQTRALYWRRLHRRSFVPSGCPYRILYSFIKWSNQLWVIISILLNSNRTCSVSQLIYSWIHFNQ